MHTLDVEAPYDVSVDTYSAWQQGNMHAGNTSPLREPGWEMNLNRAMQNFAGVTVANKLVRVTSVGEPLPFVDLDKITVSTDPLQPHSVDGAITTNPNYVIFANPIDCGEIAIHGLGSNGESAIGLFHASRDQVDKKGYIPGIEYLFDTHNIDPATATVRVSPSARVDSYAFADISEHQKTSSRWKDYIYQDSNGQWHVDFHRLTLDDLRQLGIKDENMYVSPHDTAHPDSPYFSRVQTYKGNRPYGGNGLLFALRSGIEEQK
jgi:copper oxidase (laccase) domain-containing protein